MTLPGGAADSTCLIGSTTVYLQEADPIPDDYVYLDHDGIVDQVIDAVREDEDGVPPLTICLVGPPGVGKTSLVWAVARALQAECFTTQGTTDCSAQDLVVFPVPADAHTFDAVASGLCTAAIRGGIALFDEIGKVARYAPEALAPLASMLDDRRVLWSDFLKRPIPVRPGFGFICTAQNDETLPDYLTRRMLPIVVHPPPPEVLLEILQAKAPRTPGMLMAAFRDWASQRTGLTPRDASLIIHFAHRRARRLAHQPLTAQLCDDLVADAADRVCGKDRLDRRMDPA